MSITEADGSQENFTYDALGRLSGRSANGGTEATTYTYPGEAEVKATDSAGDRTIVWYNQFGEAARVQDLLGGISTFLYDINGNLLNYTDAAGGTYRYEYDQNGNLTRAVNPLGQTVRATYNSLSELTSITDADNNTQYSYSATGNLLGITYPDGTQQLFTYDPLGNMSETIEQDGDPVSYQYNDQGLVTQESFADGTYQTFGYDSHGNILTAQTYDAGGNLAGTTTMIYNAANELTNISYPGDLSLTFTYDSQGQRITSVDQSGYTINYSYDTLGRLSELTDGSGDLIVQYTYNSLGQLQKKLNGNGTYTTYAYDAAGNLTSEINYAGGTTVNSSFDYSYNVLNEMTSVTDASGNVTTYGYDATGQLTQVTLPGGGTLTYVYNAAGDRTEVIDDGTAKTYSSNDDNEITQVGSTTYTYDANGNLASVTDASGTTTYTYNNLNQLVSISGSDGTVTDFQYSPLGDLVGETVNGAQTNYLIDPTGSGNIVAAYSGSGSLVADYTYGLGLVSQTSSSGTGYYDFDASGNTIGITGSSGTYVNQYSYLPFGETTTISASLPDPFQFAGQDGVVEISDSLFYMRARYYDVSAGQFQSADPLNLAGGDTNLRRYVDNNPTNSVDPSGLCITAEQSEWDLEFAKLVYDIAIQELDEDYQSALDNNEPQSVLEQIQDEEAEANTAYSNAVKDATTDVCPPEPPLPPPGINDPFGDPIDVGAVTTETSHDPNALLGPAGYGTDSFIQATGTLPYTIDFENDGTAAAQVVTVTEQLSPNLDWSTFQLGSFGFGTVNINIPAGLTQYQTTVSYQNSDGSSLNVQVTLDFNVATGLLTVTFVSLDPLTGQTPTGVFDGFLYPESQSLIGSDGYVQYTVQLNPGLTTGTTINQQASVVFDTNAPLNTAVVTNTIDTRPPTSTVAPLPPTETSTAFMVSWSGQSEPDGSGIAFFNVYVSDDGGPFTLWQSDTTQTSAMYTGVIGHTYGFYSVATDNVGNVQPTPTSAQATTQIVAAQAQPALLQFSSVQFTANITDGSTQIVVSRVGNDSATVSVVVSSPGGPDVAAFQQIVSLGPNTLSAAVTIPIMNNGQPGASDAVIPLSLSSPGSGAMLGAAVSANLVIHDNNPLPPPVTVTALHVTTEAIKVGTGKKAKPKKETVLELQLSGALSGAGNLAAYQLLAGKTRKHLTTFNKPVPLAAADYSASATAWSVTLIPASKLNLSQPEQLRITAADLTDAFGRPLDGADNGQPGSDFVATLSKNGVTIPSAVRARASDAHW